jgi:predicted AAA+ superfamily ATPase
MDSLLEKSEKKIKAVSPNFYRSLMDNMAWDARLIGIRGARGVGKTTMMLQYLQKYTQNPSERLYVSLDDLWFSENKLVDLADAFVKRGGKHLFIDEVHKYNNWSQEVKNIYDDYPELQVVFTGSSLLEIINARADLSRRAIHYNLQGLSFREYLNLTENKQFPIFELADILSNHQQMALSITEDIKPLKHFSRYLKSGYYPFFLEDELLYHIKVAEVVNFILEIELPLLRKMDIAYVHKIKQLLQIISRSVPFKPNVSKLSKKIQINRNTLVTYLHFLNESRLTINLFRDTYGVSQLKKPEKIYLENTNLSFALYGNEADKGNLRETFFINQLKTKHAVTYTEKGDFMVDEKMTFEVGGNNKSGKQIENVNDAYIALDDIEIGNSNKVPLWMFGFLY